MILAERAVVAVSVLAVACTAATGSVYFRASMDSQLMMDAAGMSALSGGWLDIRAQSPTLTTQMAPASVPGAQGWVNVYSSNATRAPNREDATVFTSLIDVDGSLATTALPLRVAVGVTATQSILFADLRADATSDTVVGFRLFTNWTVQAGTETVMDGGAYGATGWSAWQTDSVDGPLAGERNEEIAAAPHPLAGRIGIWWHTFSVTVPAGGSTAFEFTTFVEGWGESASVPSAGSATLVALAGLIAAKRRRR